MVHDDAPNAPAGGGFDLIIGAAAGSALGSSGAPYTLTISAIDLTTVSQPWPPQILHQAFDAASGWELSGTGPDYESTQTIPQHHPGRPGRPPGRPHPAVRGLPRQPRRPDRHHPPKRPIRPRLTRRQSNRTHNPAAASTPAVTITYTTYGTNARGKTGRGKGQLPWAPNKQIMQDDLDTLVKCATSPRFLHRRHRGHLRGHRPARRRARRRGP